MAVELAGDGITANAIVAGSTETELFRANTPPGRGEARYLRSVPMSRFGQPDEIAAAIAFLAEENPAFITGQILFVDRGASLGVSRARYPPSEFLDCTSKPFSDCLQMVRSLNPQTATPDVRTTLRTGSVSCGRFREVGHIS